MIKREDIKFEAEHVHDDRTQFGEGKVLWIDLVWRDWRLERGHSMEDNEWSLFYQGRYFETVRSIRKAKDNILEIEN